MLSLLGVTQTGGATATSAAERQLQQQLLRRTSYLGAQQAQAQQNNVAVTEAADEVEAGVEATAKNIKLFPIRRSTHPSPLTFK